MTNSFQLNETTITKIQQTIESGDLTSLELTTMYLKQIAAYNSKGPNINAVIEVNPDALHIAEALDAERSKSGSRGPLHGIPILIKDNIDSGDKMHTSAGSLALDNHYAREDAFVTKQLRKAGAVILGKTNLTEWANFMTEGMPNGYSSRGGQVLNPYGPGSCDVGGSSSGSGAGVAANFAVGAIGTETDGSILSPSSSNSLVGIKPTVGLVSRTGIIPIAHSQDTAGPMTRSVADAAIILGAITGLDQTDVATRTNTDRITDYTPFLNKAGLANAKIGVPASYLNELDDPELALFNHAIKDLEKLGATIVDSIDLPSDLPDSSVLYHEFKNGINAYLGRFPANSTVRTLRDVINFNQTNANEALEYGQTTLIKSETKDGTLADDEYIMDRLTDLSFSREKLQEVIREHKLDAILFPNYYGSSIAAKAGYPSITVPAGYTSSGKPVGVTFTGLAFSEAKLIELAYAYEQGTHHRKPPEL
ncbi:amidase family protein [Virgibacillus phasianinus]|uniref:amidase family protein n=1 Tax=Virgibacillus phasianinus TaxID=2017483 RepID=UPI00155F6409|nr:amidase family protein [Virgibacillus phasianinus]